jgi:acetylornithine aminotransferase/acetylornithine/N-succinyldiaminopimelate aminotransferase
LKRRILINRTSDTVLRFLPPFILEREHVDAAVSALDAILTALTSKSAALTGQKLAMEKVNG